MINPKLLLRGNPLELEITTVCNLSCPGCPRTTQADLKSEWNTGHMDPSVLQKLLEDPNNTFRNYVLCGCYGDPMYNPKFDQFLTLLIDHSARFTVETNGTCNNQKMWDRITQLKFDSISHTWVFSVDGLEDTNHLYRRGSNWNSIRNSMQTLAELEHKPHMVWKWIEFPYNRHQTETARELSKQWGFDKFRIIESTRYQPYQLDDPDLDLWLTPEQKIKLTDLRKERQQ